MKKLLLLSTLISSLALAGNTVEFRIGGDLSNRGKFKGGFDDGHRLSKNTFKRGLELALEQRVSIGTSDNFELGGGIAYKYSKLNENVTEKKGLHSVPVYATARYNFKNSTDITPYVKANLGYAFNSGKLKDNYGNYAFEAKFKGGIYSGIGVGLQYQNFVTDLSYNWNNARVSRTYNNTATGAYAHDKFNLNHGVLTLGVGYSFGF